MKKYKKTYTIAIILIVGIIVFSTIAFSINQYLLPLLPIKYQNWLFFFCHGGCHSCFIRLDRTNHRLQYARSFFQQKRKLINKVKQKIKKIWFFPNAHLSNDKVEKNNTLSSKPSIGIELKSNDYGITIDSSGEYTISIDPIRSFFL